MSRSSARSGLALVAVIGLGGLSACSTHTYEVKVDSTAKITTTTTASVAPKPVGAPDSPAPQSYAIHSHTPPPGGEDSLRYKEATDFVRTALSGKGMYEAPNPDSADMVVDVDYGTGTARNRIENVTMPVYAQVGGGVRYQPVTSKDDKGNPITRTVAVYDPPREELVGYDEVQQRVTVYEKYLTIAAHDNRPGPEGQPNPELWTVHTSTEDQSKDMRKYLPIMASASIEYIGQDTGGQKIVKVRDPSILTDFVRKGMNDPAPANGNGANNNTTASATPSPASATPKM